MSHQDKISILITFIVGLLAGSYLYLTGFATTFKLPEVTTDDVYTEFVIIGESYGACEDKGECLSFQLLENGRYRALFAYKSEAAVTHEGAIPFSLRRELKKNLTPTLMTLDSKALVNAVCQFGDDGTNYRFRISRDEVSYVLDTCLTEINYSGIPWQTLTKLWNYYSTVEL